ncbi:MAG: hypothetical protein A2V99_00660 [Spirochaetes bacterium RBG_16_67_19]|nr:MAG: hypothetical protein A2V99_00660 [Spirochaetes bacterium RBG_16_67_19]
MIREEGLIGEEAKRWERIRNAGVRGGVRWLSRSDAEFQASLRRAELEEREEQWWRDHPIEAILKGRRR